MRTIKLRAWDTKNKIMMEPFDLKDVTYSSGFIPESEQNHVFMQFTGLLDKNEKEIYEGDILKVAILNQFNSIGMEIGIVVFNSASAQFVIENKLKDDPRAQDLNWHDSLYRETDIPQDCEIIGNVYENQELLK